MILNVYLIPLIIHRIAPYRRLPTGAPICGRAFSQVSQASESLCHSVTVAHGARTGPKSAAGGASLRQPVPLQVNQLLDPAREPPGVLEPSVYECWSPPTTAVAPWGTLDEAWDPASEPRARRCGGEVCKTVEAPFSTQ